MRHLVLVLMLVLLPLRGWLGEAMATEMAAASATAAMPAAHGPAHAGHHAGHDAAAAGTADCDAGQHDAGDHGDGATCLGCQACHSLAMTTDVHAPPATRLPSDRPGACPPAFSSAVPARGLKPPIL